MKEKIRVVHGLCECPIDSTTPSFYINSGKQFQIRCPKCGIATKWTTKTSAIISWFNMCARIRDTIGAARE